MADTDEAAIHLPSSHDSAPQIETDLSDETQDFRFLNQIALATPDSSQSTLPRRGEKDFEPNPTNYQADVLAASRQAMHNALSWPRLHHSKNKVVAFYAPDGPAPPAGAETASEAKGGAEQEQEQEQESIGGNGGVKKKPVKTGVGVPAESCVYVPNPKGQYFKSIGRADRWNRVWLLPEEALYLLERGSLDIRWPVYDEGEDGEGIPMSLQAAYACFIGRGGLAMERFSVYTGLRRLGYTVVRAPGWDDDYDGSGGDSGSDPATGDLSTAQQKQGMGSSSVFGRFLQWLYSYGSSSSTGLPVTGPVVGLGIHRNYNDIYSKLATIRYHDPTASTPPAATKTTPSPPFRVVFNIYKPSTTVKKSAPPPPDFRIAVVSTQTQTTIPTLSQVGALLESTPLDPPRGEKMDRMLYMRLRHGYRNVILAVVDQGVVSYLRVGDAAFGREKIYKEKGFQGGKRGGGPRPKKK